MNTHSVTEVQRKQAASDISGAHRFIRRRTLVPSVMAGPFLSVQPSMHLLPIVKAFAIVVVGGLGTVVVALAWLRLFPDLAKRDTIAQ